MTTAHKQLRRSDLAGASDGPLVASGVFQFADALYEVIFRSDGGLNRCLDFVLGYPEDDPAVARLHLTPTGAKFPSCNLRFHVSPQHDVAAAVLIALDSHDDVHPWMSRGTSGRDDVVLAHDTWNPDDTRFPPESFISVGELRSVVSEWAFGDVLPPAGHPVECRARDRLAVAVAPAMTMTLSSIVAARVVLRSARHPFFACPSTHGDIDNGQLFKYFESHD